jgi:hypothetical protein
MDLNEGMEYLKGLYKDKDWFHSVGTDQYGRLVVYVNYMCDDNLRNVVDNVGKTQVLVHFSASKTATRDQFVDKPQSRLLPLATGTLPPPPPPEEQIVDIVGSVAGADTEEKSLRHLQNELDRLEKMCGSYTLQDIFYEVQDGKNAVTNLSARYPEVRKSLEKLFDQYGFDVIYEELDG